jgi:tetratricopeptide (TPR) repeat protein
MMDQVSQELSALKQAIQDDPKDVVALGRLGGLYMDAGMYDQAIDYFRRAVEAEPADVHMRTEMATTMLMMGQAREALTELEDCIELDPGHGKTWYWKGLAHVEVGEYEKGEASFAKALELMPGSFDLEELRAEIEKIKAQRASESGGASPS